MSRLQVPIWKRSLDVFASSVALVVLSPVFVTAAVLIKWDSHGPVFFRQERVGQGGRSFAIFKFRTMVADAPLRGRPLTAGGDPRVTRVGKILRKTKIDELPQLLNVLRGEMSLVGPRPEVPRYVEMFGRDYEEILRVPPGITDFASLKYRDEESLLRHAPDPEHEYVTRVLPDKIRLGREYVSQCSLRLDLSLIAKTVKKVFLS